MMSERQVDIVHEHDLHDHEVHDQHSEHVHEGHVCSATCDHHQAVQHIDLMEPVERHDHSHDTHENVHGPNCAHKECQHVHDEIDKGHVHDEHCEHSDHHEAVEHVDHGKNHGHDEKIEHHEDPKHVHGPNCSHVESEEAHKYIDKNTNEQLSPQSPTEQRAAGDATSSSGGQQVEIAAKQTEAVVAPEQKAKTDNGSKSERVPARESSSGPNVSMEKQASVPPAQETPAAPPIDKEIPTRHHDRQAPSVEVIDAEEPVVDSTIEDAPKQVLPTEQEQPAQVPEVEVIEPTYVVELESINAEPDDVIQAETPLILTDEESDVGYTAEPPFMNESFEANEEMPTDFLSDEMNDVPNVVDEVDALPLDFTENEPQGTDVEIEEFEEAPSRQPVENSVEDFFEAPTDQVLDQALDTESDSALIEQQQYVSDFANGQMPEVFNIEWPALAEVSSDELETRLDTTRTYIVRIMEQANEIDPSELVAMSDQLVAMLQDIPEESIEELLPQLNELTELYELPRLEKLLELYFAGHYQDQGLFTRLFGSAADDTGDITVRIGQTVLELLKRPKYVGQSAA